MEKLQCIFFHHRFLKFPVTCFALPCPFCPTLLCMLIFFLAKATKQRSVIDKTAAKLKTSSEIVVCCRSPCGVGDLRCLETRLAGITGGALDAP